MGCLRKLFKLFLVLLVLLAGLFVAFIGIPFYGWGLDRSHQDGPPPLTPAWALECWLWEDDVNTAEFVNELLRGYEEHDFPVRTILIDSPWSTRYNDYVVDEERYPNPAEFFGDLQNRGYRVVLWTTNNVNSRSKDTSITDSAEWHAEAAANGYLVHGNYITRWWKGAGGMIDYTNPEAMQWWRGMQQQVFDWGIDGWKLDGTPTVIMGNLGPIPIPYGKTQDGWMTIREYMDHYYCDEYQHGLTQNPEFITLSRAVDDGVPYIHLNGFAPKECAPVTWVGDQDHAWKLEDEGIEEALRDIMKSAKLGYNIIGSDVAGYSGGLIEPNVYIRWAQFSAFCGLFLNGGHGERRMWERTPQELEIVREYSWLHTELIPYMYHYVVTGHEGGPVLMRPTGTRFDYHFGDAFFISPFNDDKTQKRVNLPPGRWRYWFDQRRVIEGPTTLEMDFPIEQFPVFVRDGAIIPMNVSRHYTGIGNKDWEGFLTLNIFPHETSAFTVHHTDNSGRIDVKVANTQAQTTITLTGDLRPHILYVLCPDRPTKVTRDATELAADTGWNFDPTTKRLTLKSDAGSDYTISY